MTGSRDRSSWTTDTSSPSRELGQHTQAYGQVISLPSFEGRFNPAIYLAWELEVEQVFTHHDFSKLERVRASTGVFNGFTSIWWSVIVRKTLITNPQLGKI